MLGFIGWQPLRKGPGRRTHSFSVGFELESFFLLLGFQCTIDVHTTLHMVGLVDAGFLPLDAYPQRQTFFSLEQFLTLTFVCCILTNRRLGSLLLLSAPSQNDTIRNNLQGRSRFMSKKDWVDPQGRKGKGYGVYRFQDKYGANVDGYSPIFSPGTSSRSSVLCPEPSYHNEVALAIRHPLSRIDPASRMPCSFLPVSLSLSDSPVPSPLCR